MPKLNVSHVTFGFVPRLACALALGLFCLTLVPQCVAQAVPAGTQTQSPGPATASPNSDVLPSESLGPDDLLEIMVSYCPELSRNFRVGSDGTLALPLLHKRLKVTGMTPSEVGDALQQELIQEHIMAEPTVNVSVIEYRSRPVSVIGAVNHPLTFQATGRTNLLDAIARAGGLAPTAGSNIIVADNHKAPGTEADLQTNVKIIPVKYLLSGADPNYNLRLEGGEEIRVPDASSIFVGGDVKRPGKYLMQSDADTTVMKAIDLSGGLDSFSAHVAYICRHKEAGGECTEIQVPLKDIMSHKQPDMVLMADDVLYVPTDNRTKITVRILNDLAGMGTAIGTGMMIYH